MEKDKWDDAQSIYTRPEDSCFAMFDSLKALDVKNNQSTHKEQIALLVSKWSDFRQIGYRMDVNYVEKHPETYLSGYLLKRVSRQISIDSVMQLYTTLADSVKNSTLGYDLLSKIYLLTDNKEFKSKNPLFNRELNKLLLEGSIHELSLQDISGKQVDFKQFKGKYLVIDTWASWCGPCIANMPAWNKLVEQYDTSVIRFITVSVDIDDSEWKQAVAAYKPGGFQLHDPAAFNGLFAVYCKVIALPKIIIADPAGNIINYDGPHPNQPEFRTLLNSLVKKTDL
jgi:thiol-disulfide isomerase/thioredoxin